MGTSSTRAVFFLKKVVDKLIKTWYNIFIKEKEKNKVLYFILELEIKTNIFDDSLEYIDETIHGKYLSEKACQSMLNSIVDDNIKRGYFDEVKSRTPNRVILSNGGSATKVFSIHSL